MFAQSKLTAMIVAPFAICLGSPALAGAEGSAARHVPEMPSGPWQCSYEVVEHVNNFRALTPDAKPGDVSWNTEFTGPCLFVTDGLGRSRVEAEAFLTPDNGDPTLPHYQRESVTTTPEAIWIRPYQPNSDRLANSITVRDSDRDSVLRRPISAVFLPTVAYGFEKEGVSGARGAETVSFADLRSGRLGHRPVAGSDANVEIYEREHLGMTFVYMLRFGTDGVLEYASRDMKSAGALTVRSEVYHLEWQVDNGVTQPKRVRKTVSLIEGNRSSVRDEVEIVMTAPQPLAPETAASALWLPEIGTMRESNSVVRTSRERPARSAQDYLAAPETR